MVIREATAADADAIARVYVESWRDTYAGIIPSHVLVNMSQRRQRANWRAAIIARHYGQTVLVADDGPAGIVGFGSCGYVREIDLPYGGEVYTLYVHPDHQNQGVGRPLLRALFRALLRKNITSALLWVLAENPARFFYEALGGRLVAVRNERLWGTVLGELAYGWDDLAQATSHHADGARWRRLPHAR